VTEGFCDADCDVTRPELAKSTDFAPLLAGVQPRSAFTLMPTINVVPTDWSLDGRNILFSVTSGGSGFVICLLPLARDKKPVKLLASPDDEMHGNFSPDGKLVEYSSNDSGKFEVYVQTFPRSDRQWQVSTIGGAEPTHGDWPLANSRRLTLGRDFQIRFAVECAVKTLRPRSCASCSRSLSGINRRFFIKFRAGPIFWPSELQSDMSGFSEPLNVTARHSGSEPHR
jgi:hypothetical protein